MNEWYEIEVCLGGVGICKLAYVPLHETDLGCGHPCMFHDQESALRVAQNLQKIGIANMRIVKHTYNVVVSTINENER